MTWESQKTSEKELENLMILKKKTKIIVAAIVTIGWRGYCKHPGKIKITNLTKFWICFEDKPNRI